MKREGRAERRRIYGEAAYTYQLTPTYTVLDSDPAEELPAKSTEIAAQPLDPPSSQVAPLDTPPSNQSGSQKKGGRPPNSRKGKLGKNQYTKDKDIQDVDGQSPPRSQSRDVSRGDDNSHSGSKGPMTEGKPGRPKSTGTSKVTMSDMRKRVAAILEFISRTQLEMAGGMGPIAEDSVQKAGKRVRDLAESLHGEDMPTIRVNEDKAEEGTEGKADEGTPSKDFKNLSCVEMMDVLTRQLVKWQKEFE
jgi:hypothetical protein